MKTGKLRKVTSFWRKLFFMSNVCKMRKSLMEYLQEEGLKCELSDGEIAFEFNDCQFSASIDARQDYGECFIYYEYTDEDYEKLDMDDKTFVADKVKTDFENHATVLAFNDSITVYTSFYFTNENMMLNLFSNHFKEMTESVDKTTDIISSKVKIQKNRYSRKIGFNINTCDLAEPESDKSHFAAKA